MCNGRGGFLKSLKDYFIDQIKMCPVLSSTSEELKIKFICFIIQLLSAIKHHHHQHQQNKNALTAHVVQPFALSLSLSHLKIFT